MDRDDEGEKHYQQSHGGDLFTSAVVGLGDLDIGLERKISKGPKKFTMKGSLNLYYLTIK